MLSWKQAKKNFWYKFNLNPAAASFYPGFTAMQIGFLIAKIPIIAVGATIANAVILVNNAYRRHKDIKETNEKRASERSLRDRLLYRNGRRDIIKNRLRRDEDHTPRVPFKVGDRFVHYTDLVDMLGECNVDVSNVTTKSYCGDSVEIFGIKSPKDETWGVTMSYSSLGPYNYVINMVEKAVS